MKVCIAPNHLFWNTNLGGHAWVFMNWALALQDIGCEVTILEKLKWPEEPERVARHLEEFLQRVSSYGLRPKVCLVPGSKPASTTPPSAPDLKGLTTWEETRETSDLLLNFRYRTPQSRVSAFKRSALIDIDPGLLQCWMSNGSVKPARHDLYFSIGETVGQQGSLFPSLGLPWQHVAPPVHLPSWPVGPANESAPFTTVTNWWGEYEILNGAMVNNEKREAFVPYFDLPKQVSAKLELSIFHQEGHVDEWESLKQHGWSARPASEVAETLDAYRHYIQSSKGEFSCAKQSCMTLQNAWISDRTICYLASGRPAIVQNTGASRFLPDQEGLLRFSSPKEAAAHLSSVESNYAHHSAAARGLAERHFDGAKNLSKLLEHAMAMTPGGESAHA